MILGQGTKKAAVAIELWDIAELGDSRVINYGMKVVEVKGVIKVIGIAG